MKSLVAAIPLLAFGIVQPAFCADSDTNPSSQTMQSQSQPPASDSATGQATPAPAKKHPPTAVMDRAAPAEKAATEADKSREHGPTSVMDRATPTQKSPGTQDATSADSAPAAQNK